MQISDILARSPFTQAQRRKRRRLLMIMASSGGGTPTPPVPFIVLSGSTIAEDASVGDLVGTFSISNASGNWLDPITYTLTDDAGGKYAIDGDDLEVAAALSDGTDSITVEADNGTDAPITRTFSITVTAVVVPGDGPIMDFSVAGNPYLVLLEDF